MSVHQVRNFGDLLLRCPSRIYSREFIICLWIVAVYHLGAVQPPILPFLFTPHSQSKSLCETLVFQSIGRIGKNRIVMSTNQSICLPEASTSAFTIETFDQISSSPISAFVRRNGTKLFVDDGTGTEFTAVGPNIYWLGLDENVNPNPSWPVRGRVSEVLAVAGAMGANAVRSTTLGVSVGTSLSVESSLDIYNEDAFAAIDWAIYKAKQYGIRLILPLTDQYDYYHGGIPTFLRFRNLPANSPADYGPFYDTHSETFGDFKTYITTLVQHVSNYTNVSMANEPTILAFETGNELGGYGSSSHPAPVEWTTQVAQLLKQLAPSALVMSGSYGVRIDELAISEIDIHSDHFYPPYSYNLKRDASLAFSHNKVFMVGEFDWTNRYYKPLIHLAVLVPVALAILILLLPRRWWPWNVGLFCCCASSRSGRSRNGAKWKKDFVGPRKAALDHRPDILPMTKADGRAKQVEPSSPNDADKDFSSSSYSLIAASAGDTGSPLYPPLLIHQQEKANKSSDEPHTKTPFYKRTFSFRQWHFSMVVLLLAPILAGIIHVFLPTPLDSFLKGMEDLSNEGKLSGSFYWSLFGRDNSCCQYVNHDDGYTLHFPIAGSGTVSVGQDMEDKAVTLTNHAWKMRNLNPFWLSTPVGAKSVTISDNNIPNVLCPQSNGA